MIRTAPTVIRKASISVAAILSIAANETSARAESMNTQSTEMSVSFDSLRERIRTTRTAEWNGGDEGPPLFIGRRFGGQAVIVVATPDPFRPDTVNANFEHWVLTARASLLLQYAQFKTMPESPREYVGIEESARIALQVRASESRALIRQIVAAGGYDETWLPFAQAYREFENATDRALPKKDTSVDQVRDHALLIDRAARDKGLHRLVRELRIEPGDVANEILRLTTRPRSKTVDATRGENDVRLLYACESGSPSEVPPGRERRLRVRVHTWHPLAPSLFKAWSAVEDESNDQRAQEIVALARDLDAKINGWAGVHPDADSIAIDTALNKIAVDCGLIGKLERFGGSPPDEPPVNP